MNILEAEDLVKGMPDDYLMQKAKQPDGEVPQYLLISEIQRRSKMRKSAQNQQQEMPNGTVTDSIMQEGIQSLAPPRMPQRMPTGPGIADDPNDLRNMSPQQYQQFKNPPILPPGNGGMAEGGSVQRWWDNKVNDWGRFQDEFRNAASATYGPMIDSASGLNRRMDQALESVPPRSEEDRVQNLWNMVTGAVSDMTGSQTGMAIGGPVPGEDPMQWALNKARMGVDRDEILDALSGGGHRDAMRELMQTYETNNGSNTFNIPPEINLPSAAAESAPSDNINSTDAMNALQTKMQGDYDAAMAPYRDERIPKWHEAQQNPDMPEGYITPAAKLGAGLKNVGNWAKEGIASLLTGRSDTGTGATEADYSIAPSPDGRGMVASTNNPGVGKDVSFSDAFSGASTAMFGEGAGAGMWDSVFGGIYDLLNGDPDNASVEAGLNAPEGKKDPGVQGRTGAQVTGTGANIESPMNTQGGPTGGSTSAASQSGNAADLLMSMYNREQTPFPSMDDMVKDQKRQAWSAAIMQLGAGIASGAKDLGIGKASDALTGGIGKANDLKTRVRLAEYEAKQKETDRDINILAQRAGIDISSERMRIQQLIQNQETRNQALRFAGSLAESMVPATVTDYDERAFYVARALESLGVGQYVDIEELKKAYRARAQVEQDNSFIPGR